MRQQRQRRVRTTVWTWVVAGAVSAMAGCGGGDPAVPETVTIAAAPTDKYLGTWSTGCSRQIIANLIPEFPNGLAEIEKITFTRISDTELQINGVSQVYLSARCTGPVHRTDTYAARIEIVGTATLGGNDKADRYLLHVDATPRKRIALVKDGRYHGFDSEAPLDADGFPTAVDVTNVLVRQ